MLRGDISCLQNGIALPSGAVLIDLQERIFAATRTFISTKEDKMKIDWAYLRKG
jgi:hypothetical protein